MSDNQETIADIIAEIRERMEQLLNAIHSAPLCYPTDIMVSQHEILYEFADRLEAAWKRERESITPKPDPSWKDICAKCMDGDIEPKHCEYYGEPNGCNAPIYGEHPTAKKSSVVGDCAKLREVVKKVLDAVKHLSRTHNDDLPEDVRAILGGIAFDANTALAAPPRNCEVGTADEQYGRWLTFCKRYLTSCSGCPCADRTGHTANCFAKWAQMPYEEGGAR